MLKSGMVSSKGSDTHSDSDSEARLACARNVLSQLLVPSLTWLAIAVTYFATASHDDRLMGWAATLVALYGTVVAVIWWQRGS